VQSMIVVLNLKVVTSFALTRMYIKFLDVNSSRVCIPFDVCSGTLEQLHAWIMVDNIWKGKREHCVEKDNE
jgi:hypothetical protein